MSVFEKYSEKEIFAGILAVQVIEDSHYYEENSMVESADVNGSYHKAKIILDDNGGYGFELIRELYNPANKDELRVLKEKYLGEDGQSLDQFVKLFPQGEVYTYFGFDSVGRMTFDSLGYLADRVIASKIAETQSAYTTIEYGGEVCEVYVDNGDISDFKEEIENGTLLECEGVCHFESYRDYIEGQVGVILDDFNDIGLYERDGSWGFYLTEKELQYIGLGDALEKEKAEYENMKDILVVGDNKFELVDELPLGYVFWNIGRNMPDGYLPLCRIAAVQPFEGARNIEVDTLKAVRLEGAQTVLRASVEGFENVEKMEAFVKRCSGKVLGEKQQRKLDKVRDALEALKPLTMERTLAKVLEDANSRSASSQAKGDKEPEKEYF